MGKLDYVFEYEVAISSNMWTSKANFSIDVGWKCFLKKVEKEYVRSFLSSKSYFRNLNKTLLQLIFKIPVAYYVDCHQMKFKEYQFKKWLYGGLLLDPIQAVVLT